MKYIKTYEASQYPQVDDWVIFNVGGMGNTDKEEYIIGQIKRKNGRGGDGWFDIKFNLPGRDEPFIHFFNIKDFKYWSNDKKELEMLIQKEKYNL